MALFGPCRPGQRHCGVLRPAVLTESQFACEKSGDGGAAVAEPRSAPSPVVITGSARVTASDRSESRMIGYHQGVAKAITGSWDDA